MYQRELKVLDLESAGKVLESAGRVLESAGKVWESAGKVVLELGESFGARWKNYLGRIGNGKIKMSFPIWPTLAIIPYGTTYGKRRQKFHSEPYYLSTCTKYVLPVWLLLVSVSNMARLAVATSVVWVKKVFCIFV